MRIRRPLLTATAVLAALTLLSPTLRSGGTAPAHAQSGDADRTGAVVVRFEADATLARVGAALDEAEATPTSSNARAKLVRLDLDSGQSVDEAIASLSSDDSVVYAEPEHAVSIADTPNDTFYPSQWHYPQMNLPATWDITTGDASVIVAVIDTGVMLTHPDLDSKITSGPNAGYDVFNDDADPTDDNGHGTFVAGIVGAESDNASWVSGVCWSCKIMPVKVMNASGQGSTISIAYGIYWAVDHGADVLNLSVGGPTGDTTLSDAVDYAWAAGVPVIAASGNNNGAVLYPAAYADALAVASNDSAALRSSFSNFGPQLDVMAPGGDVVGTTLGGGYGAGSGTSFASPHVAGLVGLMIAHGITDKNTIISRLKSTATDMDVAGFDNNTGWGRVNAQAAVDLAPTVSITAPAASAVVGGAAVSITATAADDVAVSKVRFEIDGGLLSEDTTAPYAASWNSTLVSDGAHTIAAKAYDALNHITTASLSVTVTNNDLTAPAASITAPAAAATIAGSAVPFTANATDNVAVIKVRFWAGATYLGYDGAAPYTRTLDTTLLPNGSTTLKIEALDAANNSTIITRQVTIVNPDSTPPTVTVDAPAEAATVSGASVTITATPTDTQGIAKVQFWAGATYLGFDNTAPYSKTFNSTAFANGPLVVKAKAIDWGNNSADDTATVTVNNADAIPPGVALTSPVEAESVSGTITITATASDNFGISKVRFWVDGIYLGFDATAAYTRSWNSASVANGAHQIKVQSVDNVGNVSPLVTVNITVNN